MPGRPKIELNRAITITIHIPCSPYPLLPIS